MSFWLIVALQTAQAVPDTSKFDLADTSRPSSATIVANCRDRADPDEIVVCGERDDRYRLPLPTERESSDRVRGEAQTGTAALTPSGPCGIFAGQRQCSKREAAKYGYGKGRDPVTIAAKLLGKLIDPDAD